MIQTSKQQEFVINEILSMMRNAGYKSSDNPYASPRRFLTTVGGYAGTGKTFMLCELRKRIAKQFPRVHVAFASFTGKAASILSEKLKSHGALFDDYIGTIHGLIYKPKTRYDRELQTMVISGWEKKEEDELIHYDILIIDEGSMVSKDIWQDLKSYDFSIITVGDHGQLPPIGKSNFNLMSDPEFKLTKVHRQAENSPIVSLSKFIRNHGYIPDNKKFSNGVYKLNWNHNLCQKLWNSIKFDKDLITLCGFNTTRNSINRMIRKKMGFKKKPPYPNERIVCLSNNHYLKIMNGQIGTVLWVMPEEYDLYRITIEMDCGEIYETLVNKITFDQVQYTMFDKTAKNKKQFLYARERNFMSVDYFDFGYCISVHKSQGSEWDKVVLFEQRTSRWDDEIFARWLYTGVTRAREKLLVISNFYD